MASESQNPCMDGKFSWPSFSIHHYIMYWPLGWLTRILNHEITKWLDYCSDLMKQLVLNSWSSDWVRTFMNARLFLILFCVPAQKECKGLFLWPLLHFKSSIVYIHLMNTKLHAKPCRWISWRLYTMCILHKATGWKNLFRVLANAEPLLGNGVSFLPPLYSPWALQHTHLCH